MATIVDGSSNAATSALVAMFAVSGDTVIMTPPDGIHVVIDAMNIQVTGYPTEEYPIYFEFTDRTGEYWVTVTVEAARATVQLMHISTKTEQPELGTTAPDELVRMITRHLPA